MKLIETKYMGPTNYMGSRVKAFVVGETGASKMTATVHYDDDCTSEEAHAKACVALLKKHDLAWKMFLAGGTAKGYIFASNYSKENHTIDKETEL